MKSLRALLLLSLFLLSFPLFFHSRYSPQSPPRDFPKIQLNIEPKSLDPRKSYEMSNTPLFHALFEGLVRKEAGGEIKAALAKGWEISPDQKKYRFFLRESFWSDGSPLEAKDFIKSWREALAPDFPCGQTQLLFAIKGAQAIKLQKAPPQSLGVKAIDAFTLEIELESPLPYFLELLQTTPYLPFKEGLYNGPFTLDKWSFQRQILCKQNPFYWKRERIQVPGLCFSLIEDSYTAWQLFSRDKLDWMGSPLSCVPLEIMPKLLDDKSINFAPTRILYALKLQTKHPLLKHQNIRKILSEAIPRQQINEKIFFSQLRESQRLISPDLLPRKKAKSRSDEELRIAFRDALAEHNISSPELSISYNKGFEHNKIAKIVQKRWEKLFPLKVHLKSFEWTFFLDQVKKRKFDVARMSWSPSFADPYAFFLPYCWTNDMPLGGNNSTSWHSKEFVNLLDKARQTKNASFLYQEAESLFLEQQPIIPLFFVNYSYLKNPQLEGIHIFPSGEVDFAHVFWKKESFPIKANPEDEAVLQQ